MKYLVVGLGNPGQEYELTRHNIGFTIVDLLATQENLFFQSDRLGLTTQWKCFNKLVLILKPSTYMNNCGVAVSYWVKKESISLSNLLVVTDDIALPFGKIRIRAKGRDGGHNGLKHINEMLQTNEYPRLRFGIGNKFQKGGLSDFVLGKWSKEELILLPEKISVAVDAIRSFIALGIDVAMNNFNK